METDSMLSNGLQTRPAEILLVEDNSGDIELTRIAFSKARVANRLHVVKNGEAALDYVFQRPPYTTEPHPDIILLDINLPKMNGIEVLQAIKNHPDTRAIPVVMLTSSEADRDIAASYAHFANSYITKPVEVEEFFHTIKQFENFWLTVVTLPQCQEAENSPSN